MPRITANCIPANQSKLSLLLNQFATELNSLGRYSASVVGSQIELVPVIAPVHFLQISPSAHAGGVNDFCTFIGQNPPKQMVDDYARSTPGVGRPTQNFSDDLTNRLSDAARTFPDKMQVVQSALAQVHRDSLPDLFANVILPWFFSVYSNGRVLAVTQTTEGATYERILRNLTALARYGFEVLRSDARRRKPFMDLLQPLEARIENIAKLSLQYNGPYIDGFCLRGIFTVFVFIPDESVHRRSFGGASVFDLLAPFSSVGAATSIYLEDGHEDTVRALHGKRNAADIDDWVRYWLNKGDATLDKLYDLCRADDGAGNVDLDAYIRGILQFERIFFEVTWCCSMQDQFLRKVVTYAVIDKITAFMRDTWCDAGTNPNSRGTDKFVKVMTAQFMVTRLSQLLQKPGLPAAAQAWLQAIHNSMIATQRMHTFPSNLIQGGSVDWGGRSAHLAQCANLPASSAVVSEEIYIGQLVRAVRNTHHGFADLYNRPFAVLSSSSGVISDELPALLPFLAFAMLDNPDTALAAAW